MPEYKDGIQEVYEGMLNEDYMKSQLDRIPMKGQYSIKIQISREGVKTNYLDITDEQFSKIKRILSK